MTFKVVIHPEPPGEFWGEVPALPGCYSQGETMEEFACQLARSRRRLSRSVGWKKAGRLTLKWKLPNSPC